LLAHAQVETAKQREAAAERERLRNSHWWSWGWGSGENPEPGQESVEESTPKGLTAAEWAKINELLEIRPGLEGADDGASMDALNGMSLAVDVTMRRNAAQLVNDRGAQILQGAFEGFKVGMRFFQKTVEVHVKLDSYGLIAPEGTLVKVSFLISTSILGANLYLHVMRSIRAGLFRESSLCHCSNAHISVYI
jgi:hypothetical protein